MSEIGRALEPLHRKLRLLAGRAVLSLMSDAFTAQVKALDGEVRDGTEVFQQYGFRSMPKEGAEGVLLALAGSRDHTVMLCVDDRRYTVTLAAGECALYDDLGKYVVLKRDGSIVAKADTKLRIEAPLLECTGEIRDRCDDDGKSMSAMRVAYNGHGHADPQGGSVGLPSAAM